MLNYCYDDFDHVAVCARRMYDAGVMREYDGDMTAAAARDD